MPSRTKVAVAPALFLDSASTVMREAMRPKWSVQSDQGRVVRRAVPVRLFERRDAGPNDRFLKVRDRACSRSHPPSNGRG